MVRDVYARVGNVRRMCRGCRKMLCHATVLHAASHTRKPGCHIYVDLSVHVAVPTLASVPDGKVYVCTGCPKISNQTRPA